jgi:glycosyltransferase involved in cell wall biosynthesis
VKPRGVLSMPLGWHAFVAMGARSAGVGRVVAHVGNYPPHWLGRAFQKFKAEVWLGYPFTARLVCCSEYVREGVVRHFQMPWRVTSVVYNGSDLKGITMRAERARAASGPGPLRVGMVARLEQHKDQDTLIEAVAILSRRRPIELLLIGEGSRRRELETLATSRGVQTQVQFLGVRRDVPEILGKLDAFAFSAKPDEGLGIALIEAMAARVPIVATDVGACKEVLEDGRLGLLVPFRDAEAMALALEEIAEGGPEVDRRVEAAARSAEARFSKQAMAAGYATELGLVPVSE